MPRLTGKKALITGGSRGIGRAIVNSFASEGATVFSCGRGERPADLATNIDWLAVDISKKADVQQLCQHIADHYGQLDILVNNAGVQVEKSVSQSTDEDWDLVMDTNAKAVFMLCRGLIPLMNTGASIINLGSISGHTADLGMALYNASKSFVHGLTRSIAVDYGPKIRCNAICPGWIDTGMADAGFELSNNPQAAKHDAIERHAVKRLGKPEDIAAMALWLASDESSFASGQFFTIDGGLTAASPINTSLF